MDLAQHPAQPDTQARAGSALGERILRWTRNTLIVGLVLSILFHLGAFIVSRFILVGGSAGSDAGGTIGGVEVAVMTETELAEITAGALGDPTELTVAGASPSEAADERLEVPAVDAAGASGFEPGPLSESIGGGGDVGSGLGLGTGAGGAGAGGGASFFGVEAQGRRFAYIVDISGSMQGDRIRTLRAALAESITGLTETSEYAVMLFSTGADPLLGGRLEWSEATDKGKSRARQAVAMIQAEGTTLPLAAFRAVIELRPKPDAVYFMTDGDFPIEMAEEIKREVRRTKLKVHCICFMERTGEAAMKEIAKISGGSYTFIEGFTR